MSGIIFRGNYGRTVYDSRKNETIEKPDLTGQSLRDSREFHCGL